jgi:hypothetical protein
MHYQQIVVALAETIRLMDGNRCRDPRLANRVRSFMGFLSNKEDENGNRLIKIDDEFHAGFYYRNGQPINKLGLMINGPERAIKKIKSEIRNVRKKYYGKSPERISNILVQLVRLAADYRTDNSLIGKNCLSSVLSSNGYFVCQDYHEESFPEMHIPHFIIHSISTKNVRIWTGDGVPPWWN